jgi:hypothetical protein
MFSHDLLLLDFLDYSIFVDLIVLWRCLFKWLVANRNSNSEFLSEKGLAIAYSSRDSGFGFKENNPSLIEQR